jgi:hypothetical protein
MLEGRGSVLGEFMEFDLILPSALWFWDRLDKQPDHLQVPMF